MKITGVRTYPYAHDLTRRLGDANAPEGFGRVAAVALFVDTDEGLSGVAVASRAALPVLPVFAERVVGEDPRSVRGLWQRMVDVAFKGGNRGVMTAAISAIDMALWDLRAKTNGVPLWKELGATTTRVRAYASGLDTPLDDVELKSFYASMAAKGFRAGKLKVGLNIDDDIRRLGIMRDALASNDQRPALMIDANEYWSPKQAIRHVREIEQTFELVWVEEPARRWDVAGLRQVSQGVAAAVATGENLHDVSEFMPLLRGEAVDVVQCWMGTSGITGALQVADAAAAFEKPVALMNDIGNAMAHVAAVLPHHMGIEVLDAGRGLTFTTANTVEDGHIVLTDQQGNGITFDMDALERFGGDDGSDTIATSYRRGSGAGTH